MTKLTVFAVFHDVIEAFLSIFACRTDMFITSTLVLFFRQEERGTSFWMVRSFCCEGEGTRA